MVPFIYCVTCLSVRLRKEYEVVADKALTTPQNTEHLMELTEYMENAEKKTMLELEERMIAARDRVQFLVSRIQFVLSNCDLLSLSLSLRFLTHS